MFIYKTITVYMMQLSTTFANFDKLFSKILMVLNCIFKTFGIY